METSGPAEPGVAGPNWFMLCIMTVSPFMANRSNSVNSGLLVSLQEALCVKARSRTWPSSCRYALGCRASLGALDDFRTGGA